MDPIQKHEGHYWLTNDAADLPFNEAGKVKPTHIECAVMHDTLNRGQTTSVPVEALTFIRSANFGLRNCGWTGDAYRYGIYAYNSWGKRQEIVLIECHGGGMQGYYMHDLTDFETWTYLTATLPEEILWNLCHSIAGAYRDTKSAEQRRCFSLFAHGRLKKRKRGGMTRVEVLPEGQAA